METHFSPSQLNTAEMCGHRYKLRYIDGIKVMPNFAVIIGGTVAKTSETDYRNKMEQGELLPGDDIMDLARDTMKRKIEAEEDIQRDDGETDGQAIDRAVTLASHHHHALAPMIEPVSVERQVEIAVPGLPNILGYVDVIDGKPHGIIIRDLKTTRKKPAENIMERNIQMTFYSWAIEVNDSIKAPVVTDWMVESKKGITIEHREKTYGRPDYAQFLERVHMLVLMIERGVFPPCSPDAWQCSSKWCGYYDNHCPYGAVRRTQFLGGTQWTRGADWITHKNGNYFKL